MEIIKFIAINLKHTYLPSFLYGKLMEVKSVNLFMIQVCLPRFIIKSKMTYYEQMQLINILLTS